MDGGFAPAAAAWLGNIDAVQRDMGVSINWGTPKWMVFVMENPIYKWMMTGGPPMTQESPIFLSLIFQIWMLPISIFRGGGCQTHPNTLELPPHFSIPRPSGSPFASGRGPWVNRPAISELFLEFQMLHNDEQKPGDKDPLVWCFLFYYNSSPGVPSWSPSNAYLWIMDIVKCDNPDS